MKRKPQSEAAKKREARRDAYRKAIEQMPRTPARARTQRGSRI